jgi:hypothetical protein
MSYVSLTTLSRAQGLYSRNTARRRDVFGMGDRWHDPGGSNADDKINISNREFCFLLSTNFNFLRQNLIFSKLLLFFRLVIPVMCGHFGFSLRGFKNSRCKSGVVDTHLFTQFVEME